MNDARSPIDILRDNFARESQPAPQASPLSATVATGSGSSGSFALAFRDESGVAKKWFKWGKTSVFDDDAVVY